MIVAAAIGLGSLALPVAVQPAVAAITAEYDYVVEPEASQGPLYCTYVSGTEACFAQNGDYWRVYDELADGHSAAAEWENYVSAGTREPYELYRRGFCIQKNGYNHEGSCNKNYKEGSKIRFRACTYESATKSTYQCSAWTPMYFA
jgi:hypothetical protein